ncbi:MAG: SWIM zinc finger family protein [Bacillota bacterium]|nr:SWIM zinc finger family protein [Bacillota bacterium]MDW7682648.1 SWIM zinc finger family protein [Bacillota bacterium]
MSRLLEDMRRCVEPHIAERGLAYYHEGLVENVRVDGAWAEALVLGNYGDYEVRVHLENVAFSECDCPYDDYCKHIAAVCYYIDRESGVENTGQPAPVVEKTANRLGFLDDLSRDALLDIVKTVAADNPSFLESLILALRAHNSMTEMGNIRTQGLYVSIEYFEKRIPEILGDCKRLFVEEDDEWDEDYYDDDVCGWDFSAGVARLHRFGQELLEMVTPEHYIAGTVGLLLCVRGLAVWEEEYGEVDGEILDGCSEFEGYLSEAFERVGEFMEHDPQARVFLEELAEWMVKQCSEIDDLAGCCWQLGYCAPDVTGLRHLESTIRRLDADFLQSERLDECIRRLLVYWWVSLCLELDREGEARAAAGDSLHEDSIARLFIRYYEGKKRWDAAKELQYILLQDRPWVDDYRGMVELCRQSGDPDGARKWLEQWFLAYPDLDLFREYLSLYGRDDVAGRVGDWLEKLKANRRYELVLDILLLLDQPDEAWRTYRKYQAYLSEGSSTVLKLFHQMKERDPAGLIPYYRAIVMEHIRQRKRSSYALAARWLKEMRDAYMLLGQKREWAEFYDDLVSEYKRFRALMDEIEKALY